MNVNFFIVGAPKSGTTSLYKYLDQHKDICMSSIKEPNYFSSEELNRQDLYYKSKVVSNIDSYNKLFVKKKALRANQHTRTHTRTHTHTRFDTAFV